MRTLGMVNMNRLCYRRLLGLMTILMMVEMLGAMAPRMVTDEELARFPIIVVAKWEKAPFRSHTRERVNADGEVVVERWEHYTKLKILRKIKGARFLPGEYDLKVDYGIAWNQEGKNLESGTSTQILGDVDDVTKPRIWFLKESRSWDPKDEKEYLSIGNFRGVQDLDLEKFYVAAGGENPGEKVAGLLGSEDRETVKRSLRFLCGARDPWPVGPSEEEPSWFYDLQEKGTVFPTLAGKVQEMVTKNQHEDLESAFLAAYVKLAGDKMDATFLSHFLKNRKVNTRVVAACLLIREKKFAGLDGLKTQGGEADLLLRMIAEIRKQKDLRLVPLLIDQLESGESCGNIGDDYMIPALKAKTALFDLTGCVFPFDVESSRKAWEAAQDENRERRLEIISKLAPAVKDPFKAEVMGTPKASYLRLANVSDIPTTISSKPSFISQSAPGMSSSASTGKVTGPKYQIIEPGGHLDFPIQINARLLLFPLEQRSIRVAFLDNGGKAGPRSWIGVVEAGFGKGWSEERKTKKVEEFWANENFKMIGQTVNGKRIGKWEFFNEAGDRIKEVDYSNGGTAHCNPEHPNNKGAGIRKKK